VKALADSYDLKSDSDLLTPCGDCPIGQISNEEFSDGKPPPPLWRAKGRVRLVVIGAMCYQTNWKLFSKEKFMQGSSAETEKP
jgi:hypothetical protein